MIEFKGKADKKVWRFVLGRMLFGVVVAIIFLVLILGVPAIIMAKGGLFILLIIVFGGIIFSFFLCIYNVDYNIPYYILIDDGNILGKYKECEKSYEIQNIKKVIDYGQFYCIKFNTHGWGNCICQKDLIIKGTIEEFEQMLEEFIVRKIPKQKEKNK